MLKLKHFKMISGSNSLQGIVSWTGSVSEMFADLYCLAAKVVGAASDFNSITDEQYERLLKLAEIESSYAYRDGRKWTCYLPDFLEMAGRGVASVDEYIDEIETALTKDRLSNAASFTSKAVLSATANFFLEGLDRITEVDKQ